MNRNVSLITRSGVALLIALQTGCSGGSGQQAGGGGGDGGASKPGMFDSIVNSALGKTGLDSNTTNAVSAGVAMGSKVWELDQLTPENEYYIGRAVAANLIARYGVVNDASATRYVSLVGYTCAMASAMPETFGGYRFIILDSDEVNAFGAPGGYILVTRGMLKGCKSEDALAAVLSHEIGHVQNRDGLNAIKSSQMWKTGLQQGANLAAQGDMAAATGLFNKLIDGFVEQIIDKGYSRDAEAKADAAGVTIMVAAGYDPHGLLAMLEEMRSTWTTGSAMGKTHPTPDQRIAKANALIKTPPAATSTAQQARFDAALGPIIGK